MKINAKISKVLETKSGTNAQSGRNWSFTNLLLEWEEQFSNGDPYRHSTIASAWGDLDRGQLDYAVQQGTLIPVSVFFSTRSYEGKDYGDARVKLPESFFKKSSNE